MFISAFCKICELNTEREIVFQLMSVGLAWKSAAKFFRTISGSQIGSQFLQDT